MKSNHGKAYEMSSIKLSHKYLSTWVKRRNRLLQVTPIHTSHHKDSMKVLDAKIAFNSTLRTRYARITEALPSSAEDEVLCLDDFMPIDRRRRGF